MHESRTIIDQLFSTYALPALLAVKQKKHRPRIGDDRLHEGNANTNACDGGNHEFRSEVHP